MRRPTGDTVIVSKGNPTSARGHHSDAERCGSAVAEERRAAQHAVQAPLTSMYATRCRRSSFDVTPEAVRRAQRRAFEAPRRQLMVVASGTQVRRRDWHAAVGSEVRLCRALGGGLYFLALNDEPMSALRRRGHIPLSPTSSPLSVYLFPRRRLTGTRLGGGIAGAIGCDNYRGVVMNLSLRRLTDIACSLAWAKVAWGCSSSPGSSA